MNSKRHLLPWLGALLLAAVSVSAEARMQNTVTAGGRFHSDLPSFPDLPFDDDWSFLLAWEGHEDDGCWQLAVDYAPEASGLDTVDYVITPQLNLLFRDRCVEGGVGILMSYIEDEEAGGDWTDLYWQMLLGLRFPVGSSLTLRAQAVYVYEDWGALDEIDEDHLDYVASLSVTF